MSIKNAADFSAKRKEGVVNFVHAPIPQSNVGATYQVARKRILALRRAINLIFPTFVLLSVFDEILYFIDHRGSWERQRNMEKNAIIGA